VNSYVPSLEVWELASQFCNGEIESDAAAHLSALLRQDATLKAWFVGYMNLHAQLQWEHRARRESSLTILPTENLEHDAVLAKSLAEATSISEVSANPQVILPAETVESRRRMADWIRLPNASPAMWMFVVSITAAFWIAVFIALSPRLRSQHELLTTTLPSDSGSVPSEQGIATLIDAQNCQWEASSPRVGDAFPRGSLTLKSGVAQVSFSSGVRATIEGPSKFELVGPAELDLQLGRIVASVPAAAIGFAVSTPVARIVDLGTEFGVETDDKGATEVQVFKGKVELRPSSKLENPKLFGAVTTLTAGEARRIEVDDATKKVVVRKINASPNRFAQPTNVSKSHPLAAAALASSEGARERGREANNLVNGRGLARGKHTNVADGTMWHAAYGKVKGEFVLFDLFRPCRIESMKVWNYNEAVHTGGQFINLFEERGLEQADIYVSATGKGDPISQPQEWRLVIENQKFALADGTADYSSPSTIPLGNVEARFAAIVIDARHHPERIPPDGSRWECVGLSEVQFFGERVPPQKSSKQN
jgi:hypothetical protein